MLDPEQLPPSLRLALSYAPKVTRGAIGTVFALDTRLARIGSEVSEPIIAQMKLAWWRDQFGKPPGQWPAGEPLLASIAQYGLSADRLIALVDGWEALLVSEELGREALSSFAAGRSASWLAVAERAIGVSEPAHVIPAGRSWALGDVVAALPPEAQPVLAAEADTASGKPEPLPRSLRPFSVLSALGQRAIDRRAPLLGGAGALGLAMRVGIFGR